jgi:hypothetical protein
MILAKFQHDLVRIAVRHQAADRRQAVHAKLAAIVNDDQVDSAKLGAFCGEPVSGARDDYRTARQDGGAQARFHFLSRVSMSHVLLAQRVVVFKPIRQRPINR